MDSLLRKVFHVAPLRVTETVCVPSESEPILMLKWHANPNRYPETSHGTLEGHKGASGRKVMAYLECLSKEEIEYISVYLTSLLIRFVL
jgi:hypothetical protein